MSPSEIGSEFWNVPVCDDACKLFPAHTTWYLSGRSALAAVIEDARQHRVIRSVGLPSWCCESMVKPFTAAGIGVAFYPVTFEDGCLCQDITPCIGCDLLLVMGYFGVSGPPQVPRDYEGIVVEDLTHSLLSTYRCEQADYRFGSLRKWCGVWTGGFAWRIDGAELRVETLPCDRKYIDLRRSAMKKKAYFMALGEGEKGYLAQFAEAEGWLDAQESLMCADSRDVVLARKLDVVGMRNSRWTNAAVLLDGLRGFGGITLVLQDLRDSDCPLFLPILVEKRDALRRYLIEKDVYCPIHWPVFDVQKLENDTRVFYDRGLSLVCDQRYGADDMLRICDLVKEWQKIS